MCAVDAAVPHVVIIEVLLVIEVQLAERRVR